MKSGPMHATLVIQSTPVLNNRGQVVGIASAASGTGGNHAFLWENGRFTDLHAIVAPDALNSGAADINDHRTIIGTADQAGFKLQGTQVTAITVVPGETSVNPVEINDRGQMIVESFGGPSHGDFFVDGDDAELLTPLPGAFDAVAVALSELGVAAGDSIFFPGNDSVQRATLWQAGRALILDDLVVARDPLKSFVRLTFAQEINDRGDIIVRGVDSRTPARDAIYFLRRLDDDHQ